MASSNISCCMCLRLYFSWFPCSTNNVADFFCKERSFDLGHSVGDG